MGRRRAARRCAAAHVATCSSAVQSASGSRSMRDGDLRGFGGARGMSPFSVGMKTILIIYVCSKKLQSRL